MKKPWFSNQFFSKFWPNQMKIWVLIPCLLIFQYFFNNCFPLILNFEIFNISWCATGQYYYENIKSLWFHFLRVNFNSLSKSSFILDTSDNFLLKQLSFFVKKCRKSALFADLKDCTLDQNISTIFSAQCVSQFKPAWVKSRLWL